MNKLDRDYLLRVIDTSDDMTIIADSDFIKELLFDINIHSPWYAKININNSEDRFLQLNKVANGDETHLFIEPVLTLDGKMYEVSDNLVLIDNYTYETFVDWDLLNNLNKKPVVFILEECE